MEIHVQAEKRLVEVWLTKAEKNDLTLRARLKDIYSKYKVQNYLVAVYESGNKDLYQGTRDLLAYNKRRCAELEVQREKLQRTAAADL